jgi:alkanesulfonate monooxygenase SsuD/methylene tetrahydromethanopterin reductase-like flavin-dependent oxidoreductase (luciferase family)
MTQVTSGIGIVPTFGAFAYPPYRLARLVATLDHVSAGRIGWNMVTGSSDFAAMNFGLNGMPEHNLRYDMADEFIDVVPTASVVMGTGRDHRRPGIRHAVDSSKVRAVNHERKFFKTRGPLNSGPAPQGRPVIAQAGGSPRGRGFAALHADTIVAHPKGVKGMKPTATMSGSGREARAVAQIPQRLAFVGKLMNIDFGRMNLDKPISGELTTNGH